ncbi:Dimethylaniline monooxygenase [N-oxide-forming] [Lachnellula suecica]|uniref:Dimethylaniline monooxygenase [N-oxide-forming] n=1 Tax=Lachnellula suecica TaxID=602035 RepID=A0A8T9BXD3_9HELO|nr:Dimethylaniline monooxygenase [N-oxide-forming] [Lachnellula suecica]
MRVAVIGGGPSGLVTLKYLKTAHEFFPGTELIEAKLFEAENSVGGTFKYRAYEGAELVSSRQLTSFSDFRCSSDTPDFLTAEEYTRYLEDYCKEFDLLRFIHLKTSVTKVEHGEKSGNVVHYLTHGQETQYHCDAVAICSGLHVQPNIPDIDGLENVPMVIHSSDFKEKKQFGVGKDVLIVGSGETGMDLAYMAVTSDTKSVTLSHRDGFHCGLKRAPDPIVFGQKPALRKKPNVPYDVGASSLFDTAYVHPVLRDSPLAWGYWDKFAKWTAWVPTGTSPGYDQWIGGVSPDRYHASRIFFNKSTHAIPYISAPYHPTPSLINKIRASIIDAPIVDTKGCHIDLAPWPQAVDSSGIVHFTETDRPEAQRMKQVICKPDMIIFASGYTQSFPFLTASYPQFGEANIRNIWKERDESVAFIGFVRPSFGAIPPLSELQAQLWILNLLQRLPAPLLKEDHYRLHAHPRARIQYGIDHESYAYQLALDMGSAPSFSQMLDRGLKMTLCWALSANVNPKFRMVGPWKWEGAEGVMMGEVWETVTRRRGPWGHFTMSVLPILYFGILSAFFYVVFGVWEIALFVWKCMMASADY